MSSGLLFKPFLRPPWLKSSLVVLVSLAFPQACCQGAKDPLVLQVLLACGPALSQHVHLSPLTNGSYCSLSSLMDVPGQHPSHWGLSTGCHWLPAPSPGSCSSRCVAFAHNQHVWIQPRGRFLELSLFCILNCGHP